MPRQEPLAILKQRPGFHDPRGEKGRKYKTADMVGARYSNCFIITRICLLLQAFTETGPNAYLQYVMFCYFYLLAFVFIVQLLTLI